MQAEYTTSIEHYASGTVNDNSEGLLMNWFRDLKIHFKLYLVFGMLVAMLITISVFASFQLFSVDKEFSDLITSTIARQKLLSDAITDMDKISYINVTKGYRITVNANSDEIAALRDNYNRYAELFIKRLNDYRSNLNADIYLTGVEKQERLQMLDEVIYLFESEYQSKTRDFDEVLNSNDLKKVYQIIGETMEISDQITVKLDTLYDLVSILAKDVSTATTARSQESILLLSILGVFIIVFSMVVSVLMTRVINTPIVEIENAMLEISKGNLDYPVRSARKDELGKLANQIGDMVDNISEMNKIMTVMANLDKMILVIDLDYNLIYINESMASMYKLDASSCKGQKCYKALKGYDQPCLICRLPRLLPDKDSTPSLEYDYLYDEALGIWIGGKSAIIDWVDGSQVYLSSIRNVTENKKNLELLSDAMEEAQAANKAKGQFLAHMSHEIRTPMNAVLGISELLLQEKLSEKQLKYARDIKDATTSLIQIINDILDMSKIEAGNMELENIPFDLRELLTACKSIILPKMNEKNIELYFYAESAVRRKLCGDPTKLRQVLLNLLSNAVKFTKNGKISLITRVISSTDDSVTLIFEVKDTGIGMTQEQITKVFEPFIQVDVSTTREYGGTGLGLPISKNILELMGSKIEIESVPDEGTTASFTVTIRTIGGVDEPWENDGEVDELEKPLFRGSVLVCEDNKMNQQVITEHLSRVGLTAEIAENGREGVDKVKQRIEKNEKPYDLIFMDIHMPVMDGIEATKKIIALGLGIPIVAMTANIMTEDRALYEDAGMNSYVGKPFTSQELWRCLLKYLKPVSFVVPESDEDKFIRQLKTEFIKSNQDIFGEIARALDSGDITLAHRLAHSLKSNAGLIGKGKLQKAAADIESALKDNVNSATAMQLNLLEKELTEVIDELKPFLNAKAYNVQAETPNKIIDGAKMRELFDKLEPLLDSGNFECLELIGDLRGIPGSEELIAQIEDFYFSAAQKTLAELKDKLGVG